LLSPRSTAPIRSGERSTTSVRVMLKIE
jgi:hypothetical protein